jgi:hypothetical protein
MIVDARTFIYLFCIALTISQLFFNGLEHIVDIPKDGNGDFVLNGSEKGHSLGKYVFRTRIEVRGDGHVWANNPFPFDIEYTINQDESSLHLTTGEAGRGQFGKYEPMTHIANLRPQPAESYTTIKMTYRVTQDQFNWINEHFKTDETKFVKKRPTL